MRRYDVYGFHNPNLEEAIAIIESTLGVRLRLRDSSYRGIYYCASVHAPHDYLLEANGQQTRWHSTYPEYGATLMVSDPPDMDAIREKLTSSRGDPVFLRSIIHAEEPPEEYPPDPELIGPAP